MISLRRLSGAYLACAALLCCVSVCTADAISLPNVGLAVADYLSAGLTAMGGAVVVAVGGFLAFHIIKRGLRWFRFATAG